MLQLISFLGPSNVFVSVYESNSEDESAAMLEAFRGELDARGVGNRIEEIITACSDGFHGYQ